MNGKHRKNLTNTYKLRIAGYASLGVMGTISMLALFPMGTEEIRATDKINILYEARTSLSIKVDPSITMTGTDTNTNRGFISGSANLTASTSNSAGYSLFMTGENGNNALVNTKNSAAQISSITSNMTGDDIPSNRWGYTLGAPTINAIYHAIPTSIEKPIYKTNAPSDNEGDQYSLSFGGNVDNTLQAGDYQSSVLVSIVANYVPPVANYPDGITEMQEMNSNVCDSMDQDTPYKLVDARDNKTYYVTRHADDRCWMTQNLAYETEDIKQIGTRGENVAENAWMGDKLTNGQDSSGNYYSVDLAKTVCPAGWLLPTKSNYDTLESSGSDDSYPSTKAGTISIGTGALNNSSNMFWTSTSASDEINEPIGPGHTWTDYYYVADFNTSGSPNSIVTHRAGYASVSVSSDSSHATSWNYLVGIATPVRCIAE